MDLQTDLTISVVTAGVYGAAFVALVRAGPYHAQAEKTRIETSTSCISMVNALVVIPCAFKLIWDTYGTDVWINQSKAAMHSSALQDFCTSMLCAYVLFHASVILQNFKLVGDKLLLLHHAVVAVSVVWAQALQVGTFYLCALCVNEVSTIPLNLRYVMLYSDMQNTVWYTINGAVLLLTFLVFRVLAIGFILGHVISGWRDHTIYGVFEKKPEAYTLVLMLTVLLSVHFMVNMIWFLQVAKHAKRGIMRLMNDQEVNDSEHVDYGACEDAFDSKAANGQAPKKGDPEQAL